MKEYFIEMDVTMSARMYIEANDLETAKKIAVEKMWQDPRYHTRNGAMVSVVITDAFED